MEILFSRHYFLHKRVYLAFFSLQLADTTNNFELILAARKEEYKKRLVKCYLFQTFRNFTLWLCFRFLRF